MVMAAAITRHATAWPMLRPVPFLLDFLKDVGFMPLALPPSWTGQDTRTAPARQYSLASLRIKLFLLSQYTPKPGSPSISSLCSGIASGRKSGKKNTLHSKNEQESRIIASKAVKFVALDEKRSLLLLS
jgi:hypothetical protein